MERVESLQERPALGDALASVARRIAPVRGFAVFALSARTATLVYGDRVNQHVLNLADSLAAEWPLQLERGAPFFGMQEHSFVLLSCATRGGARGVAYLEVDRPLTTAEHDSLRPLMAVWAHAGLDVHAPVLEVADLPVGPARLETQADVDSANLAALLEQHEWNISVVARLLKVTRMTIYNRLRRLGLRLDRGRRPAEERLAS